MSAAKSLNTSEIFDLHQSIVSKVTHCGLQYYFSEVMKIKTPSNPKLLLGNIFDEILNLDCARKLKSGNRLSKEEVTDLAVSLFHEYKDAVLFDEDDTPESILEELPGIAEAFADSLSPQIRPVAIQPPFLIEIDGKPYNLAGTRDIDEEGHVVTDLKISGNPSRYKIGSYQSVMYSLAYYIEHDVLPTFRYAIIKRATKTQKPKVEFKEGQVTEADIQRLLFAAESVYQTIKTGNFMPAADSSNLCSPKYCGYWNICKGRK